MTFHPVKGWISLIISQDEGLDFIGCRETLTGTGTDQSLNRRSAGYFDHSFTQWAVEDDGYGAIGLLGLLSQFGRTYGFKHYSMFSFK